MENLQLLFYKTLYKELKCQEDGKLVISDIEYKTRRLLQSKFYEDDYQKLDDILKADVFYMKTQYPGLLTGSGYAHGTSADGETKIGFSFDYVTGQPYIPGSSVKGVLKNYFKVPQIFNAFSGEDNQLDEGQLKALTKTLFDEGGISFLDAVILHGNKDGYVMGEDYITPHSDPMKNPTPLKFIKVLPDVVFEFRFIFNTAKIDNEIITKEKLIKIFVEILSAFGVGAKTNVGYGVLNHIADTEAKNYTYPDSKADKNYQNRGKQQQSRGGDRSKGKNYSSGYRGIDRNVSLEQGSVVECRITAIKSFGAFADIIGTRKSGLIHISEISYSRVEDIYDVLAVGDVVKAKITSPSGSDKISLSMKRV
ncbi:MAG: type III-B CRISPR module RAMP protein Cmr6 [Faecalibacterium sp.]|nr:type III-B CRISPR module RAMP protein Cmr6 [Ruminococcus sp.]MCM1392539.1 type III-B CRISPR module RAMP protein Cmr6 [Ruminococcus sp.]MCM1486423.1 type III-B CRISPR module RAMP protein Cmr6 [Faecalibacterium sp.]